MCNENLSLEPDLGELLASEADAIALYNRTNDS